MSTIVKERLASPAAIQRAKFANAFDTLSDHYQFSIKEYQTQKFEIGCEFADHIHPLVSKNQRFWEYWNFRWNMDCLFLAKNLDQFGKYNFYDFMRECSIYEKNIQNAIDYINRVHDTQVK